MVTIWGEQARFSGRVKRELLLAFIRRDWTEVLNLFERNNIMCYYFLVVLVGLRNAWGLHLLGPLNYHLHLLKPPGKHKHMSSSENVSLQIQQEKIKHFFGGSATHTYQIPRANSKPHGSHENDHHWSSLSKQNAPNSPITSANGRPCP